MSKEGGPNLTLTEGKRDKCKLTLPNEWIVEQDLGEIAKCPKFIKRHKGQ